MGRGFIFKWGVSAMGRIGFGVGAGGFEKNCKTRETPHASPTHYGKPCIGYRSFVNTMDRSSLYQLTALKKIFFCSQKSITSTFPLS